MKNPNDTIGNRTHYLLACSAMPQPTAPPRPPLPRGVAVALFSEYRACFPGVKRPGRDIDHSPPPNASVPSRSGQGQPFLTFLITSCLPHGTVSVLGYVASDGGIIGESWVEKEEEESDHSPSEVKVCYTDICWWD